jgi:hypothetical protein
MEGLEGQDRLDRLEGKPLYSSSVRPILPLPPILPSRVFAFSRTRS